MERKNSKKKESKKLKIELDHILRCNWEFNLRAHTLTNLELLPSGIRSA